MVGRTRFVNELEHFHPRNRIDKRLLIGLLKRKHIDPSDEESDDAVNKLVRQLTKKKNLERFKQSFLLEEEKDIQSIENSIALLIQNARHVEMRKKAVPAMPRHTPKGTANPKFFSPSNNPNNPPIASTIKFTSEQSNTNIENIVSEISEFNINLYSGRQHYVNNESNHIPTN